MKFHVFGTLKHGEEKSLSNIFLLFLAVICGDFIEQIKKNICHMHLKLNCSVLSLLDTEEFPPLLLLRNVRLRSVI